MTQLITATLSSKAQITLPKRVREALGIRSAGELIGFRVDTETHRVELTRLKVVPDEPDFSEAEYRKLLGLSREKGGKTFKSGASFLRSLKTPK